MAGTRRCWKCKNVSEAEGMRYDSSGKDLICLKCLALENRAVRKETAETIIEEEKKKESVIEPVKIGDINEESKTISYQCGSCSLGFSAEKGSRVTACPYCGKGNFRIAFRDSAQNILEDSGRKEFDS